MRYVLQKSRDCVRLSNCITSPIVTKRNVSWDTIKIPLQCSDLITVKTVQCVYNVHESVTSIRQHIGLVLG